MRYFNTAGPVNCADHYCLPPLERFDLGEVLMLIEQRKYFVLHAPRQTGKTTCLEPKAPFRAGVGGLSESGRSLPGAVCQRRDRPGSAGGRGRGDAGHPG